jgi:hypothetical protein
LLLQIKYLFSFLLILTISLQSCSTQEIPLDIVRQSSELIHSDKIFGTSLKKIEEENEILLETGNIDTTDEHAPIYSALIKVQNVEIILNLVKSYMADDRQVEEYTSNGYKLVLSYKKGNENEFDGKCTITSGKLKSTYNLVGVNNTHLY